MHEKNLFDRFLDECLFDRFLKCEADESNLFYIHFSSNHTGVHVSYTSNIWFHSYVNEAKTIHGSFYQEM